MGKPVARLLSEISSRELTEWIEYAKLEPFGEERADLRSAIVAATVANVNRGKKQKPFKPSDFMVDFASDRTARKQTTEEMIAIAEAVTAALGGQDLRNQQ